jgi:hypothetical protein
MAAEENALRLPDLLRANNHIREPNQPIVRRAPPSSPACAVGGPAVGGGRLATEFVAAVGRGVGGGELVEYYTGGSGSHQGLQKRREW